MIELMKKAVFTGLGIVSLSKDKVESLAKDLIEQGALSENEGRKFVSEVMSQVEESKTDVKNQVENYVKLSLEKLDVATKSDIEEIRNTLKEIEKKIDSEK